jgi:hypothetical protein
MGKRLSIWISSLIFILTFIIAAATPAFAQSGYTQEDLDALLAPVALYPDELLTQVLIAATYPQDVAAARAYLDRYPSLQHSSALLANQAAAMPWDDSVKSVAQFPSILAMLDDRPDWTDALGYAVVHQQADVMRTVQRLRWRAVRAGYLKTNSWQIVDVQRSIIVIMPTRDGFFHIPYYDPSIVYGRWPSPNRPPYRWDPPRKYQPEGYTLAHGIFPGPGTGVINSIFYPVRPDWRRHVFIIIGGRNPGAHWQWKSHPPRQIRSKRPNHPPATKPALKPAQAHRAHH